MLQAGKEECMNKKVAAIVVTYNRKELLLENIEALRSQTAADLLDILVIDNASTDGTKQVLEKYISAGTIIYINTGENLGGAGGFQYGIQYACQQEYSFIWVMDDDCIPSANALEQFLLFDQQCDRKYGFLSSKALWKDGDICQMNVQRKTVFRDVAAFEEAVIQIEMASFVSLFVPCQIIREIGLPIKEFFIWSDDWEYTRRISQRYPCYLITTSNVTHKSASNFGANIAKDDKSRLERYYYIYRNDVYLYRREGIKGYLYLGVRFCLHLIRILFQAQDNKWNRIKIMYEGTRAGRKFQPCIVYPEQADA